MQWIIKISIAILAAVVTSCGHDDTFHVKGELDDGSSINLRYVYITNGGVASGITASNHGKFMFEGRSSSPALVEVYDNDYRLMGRLVAANGEDIDLTLVRKNPYLSKASGNELSKRLSAFFNENAELMASRDDFHRNAAIAAYIASHPDDPISDILLSTEFTAAGHEQEADSLLGLINPDARFASVSAPFAGQLARLVSATSHEPVAGMVYRLMGNREEKLDFGANRRTLVAFTDGRAGRDSVVMALRRLARHRANGRFEILDLNMDADTTAWKRTVSADSATWKQGWLPGAVAGRGADVLGIPGLPYFVLADSAGNQLWRGSSATLAISETVKHLAK